MARFFVFILLFALFFSTVFAQLIDSDNDGVSDAQEAIDGTDASNAASNRLEIRVEGDLVVGNTINVSLVHPLLGNIKNADFVFLSGGNRSEMNSGASGTVRFEISSAGMLVIEARKGDFFLSREFYPACSVQAPIMVALLLPITLLSFFAIIVIVVLSFAGFKRLLIATESDYPLKKHAFPISLYVGFSCGLIAFFLYNALGTLLGMIVLFFMILLLLVSIWLLREGGFIKPVREKPLPKKARQAVKSLAFPTLLIAAFLEKIGRKRKQPETEKNQFSEIWELKEGIAESLDRFEDAKKKTAEAKDQVARQEAMTELKNEVFALNNYFKRLLGFKEPKIEPVKAERQKTLAELREEKRIQIMVDDLLDQMAKELNLKELPDVAPPKPREGKKTAKGLTGLLYAIFIGGKKEPSAENANVEINLFDEFGNPLQAENAEFFVEGKKTEPLLVKENTAFFKLKAGEHQVFVRLLGFADNFLELRVEKEKRSFKANLLADLRLTIKDEKGESLRDAFVNIVDDKGKRVEDVLQNIIWRTPTPSNAPDGVVAIPLNPKELRSESIHVKIVRAQYALKEIIIPASRISTQKVLEKTVSLEKLQK
ncbi:MAG: thrombospondin type 3 repeat-containing protein [Candidatus Diapherotrites archaeon]